MRSRWCRPAWESPLGVPWSALSFPTRIFVPIYVLSDVPTGIPIQSWWTTDLARMVAVSGGWTLFFFTISVVGVRKRDFTL